MRDIRRRSLLGALAAGSLTTVAGCSAFASDDGPEDKTPKEYDFLATQQVYVAPAVSLTVPSAVPRVEAPKDATLLILPDTTDVAPETGINWLASDNGVAFVGAEGQATLVEWVESDAYAEAFDSNGFGVGSPPPDFLVAFGVDRQYISKHSFTWNDTSDPDDERYLTALEDALEDVRE